MYTGYTSDPQLLTHNMFTAALQSGKATFILKRDVVAIVKDDSKVTGVRLDNGDEISCMAVVNAAGPHSSKITSMAFDKSPYANDMNVSTRPWRAEVAYVDAPDVKLLPITGDMDVGVYFRPEFGGRLLIGSVEPPCDDPEWVENADALDTNHTDLWNNLVYRAALRLPAIKIPTKAQGIVAMYDVTEDWMPIYDKSSLPGYFMAIGTSGNQFKNAAIAGRMMAEMITRDWDGMDQDRTPLLLELPLSRNILNTTTYSRLRPVEHDTTGSVLS